MLEFDWDEGNLPHIARHRVSAAEVEYVLSHPTLDIDFQNADGEERFAEVGSTSTGRILMVVTTWRKMKLRVVTAFDAPPSTAEEYHQSRWNLQ